MIGRAVRALRSVLSSKFGRSDTIYAADFTDESFRDALSSTLDALGHNQNQQSDWRESIVSHFRDRVTPVHFVTVEGIKRLADDLSRSRPQYKDEIVLRARDRALTVFDVYNQSYPGLVDGFDWDGLEPGPGGDTLYLERPHRFEFAPLLGMAGMWDELAIDNLSRVIGDWLRTAAADNSRAYGSCLIVLYRILALHWCFMFLCAAKETATRTIIDLQFHILKILRADVGFLAENAGNSVANNHLLADGFGLWYVGLQFPEFLGAEEKRAAGEALWLRELERQIYDDGTSFEHSVHYHELACEMALTYLVLSSRNGKRAPNWAARRAREMFAFQASCYGPYDVRHLLGDTTEDLLLPLDISQKEDLGTMRQLNDALYGPLFTSVRDSEPLSGRALWTLSRDHETRLDHEARANEAYSDGGYFFFSEGQSRVLFRTGPAPEVEIFAGHMHYDFLSLYLTVQAQPLVVEAGTYTYRSRASVPGRHNASWRSYLLGPESHNGLVIDDSDPLNFVGDFRNSHSEARVRARFLMADSMLSWVEGSVEGAASYSGHCRGVLHVPGEYFVVYDILEAPQVSRSPILRFQLARGASVEKASPGLIAMNCGEASATWAYSERLVRFSVSSGATTPLQGWTSPSYGDLGPAPSIAFELEPRIDTNVLVLTTSGATIADTVDLQVDGSGLVVKIAHASGDDWIMINRNQKASTVCSGETELEGRAVWVRTFPSGEREVRALGLSRFLHGDLEITSSSDGPAAAVHLMHDERSCNRLDDESCIEVRLKGLRAREANGD